MKKNKLFERIYQESQKNDWYSLIEQKLSEYTNLISLAIIGEQAPDFKRLSESKTTNQDYIRHLTTAQSFYTYIERQLELSKTLTNINIETAPGVTVRINQDTASMKSLETDLENEGDTFKKCVLRGAIVAYKFILQQIIESITRYNANKHTNIPLPRSW